MHAAHDTIWQTIDQTLLGLAARAGDLDAEIGRWLVAAAEEGVHRHFGFASFAEYVERRLGFDARTTRERLRVARALESLPEVRRSLASGERSWSAVREITRVATPENESAWVAKTERMTVRQIERLVAGRRPGDDPTDAKDPLLMTRRVAFELEAEAYAEWSEACEALRRVIGPGASDKEVSRAMCEIALGRRDEAKPGYQVSLTVCMRCDRSWRQSGPDAIEVPASVGERAACDAEVVGFTCVDEGVAEPAPHVGPVPEEPADAALRAPHVGPVPEAMAGPSELRAPHVGPVPEAIAARAEAALRAPHVGPLPEAIAELLRTQGARGLVRAVSAYCGLELRALTKATRRRIALRDHHRCSVPGCRNFRFVDVHHLRAQSMGGKHDDDQLTSLCTQHHDAVHDGRLAIEGKPSTGLRFVDARGEIYGSRPTWATSTGGDLRDARSTEHSVDLRSPLP